MSRIRSAASAVTALDRRTLLVAAASATAATGLGLAFGPGSGSATASQPPQVRAAVPQGRHRPRAALEGRHHAGDRLRAPRRGATGGSARARPGRVVRTELAGAHAGRADRRTTLASFVQFTDLHLTDVQHPLRLSTCARPTGDAWRPHEALTVPARPPLVERINALRGAPVTGSPLHFVMTTGDNTDNNAHSSWTGS